MPRSASAASARVSSAARLSHRQLVLAPQRGLVLLPPHVGDAAAVGQDHDLVRSPAGAADALFVGQADVDPQFDGAGQVLAPEVGFVFGGKALAE
jgi:hypothetical protein